jgi:predicted transposase YdaD
MPLTELITPLEEIAMAKGEAKGLAEGLAKGGQQAILDALEVRFGTVPEDLRKQVEQIADESRLRRALRLAITEPSLQTFLANL